MLAVRDVLRGNDRLAKDSQTTPDHPWLTLQKGSDREAGLSMDPSVRDVNIQENTDRLTPASANKGHCIVTIVMTVSEGDSVVACTFCLGLFGT
jgi:hypothetical protein